MSQNQWGGAQPQWDQQQQPQQQGWETPGGAPGGTTGEPDEKERLWGMLSHLSPLLIGFIGPLIIMLMPENLVGHPSAYVKHHAKQSLIWCIALIIVAVLTCGVGGLVMMIWQVIAGLEANKGQWYVYPGLSSFVDN